MAKKFKYKKSIHRRIASAVSGVLKVKVIGVNRITQGEINHVFKISTNNGNLLAKVFQYGDWPENGMLEWIEKQLSKNNVPHAKILYYSRARKYFPFGFMITEFIDGLDGRAAVEKHKISLAKAYWQIGHNLKKIHLLKVKKFGNVNKGRGSYKSFLSWKLENEVNKKIKLLKPVKQFPRELAPIIISKIKSHLLPFEKKLKPVLNHGDPSRENAIWSKQKQWVFIDWDNSFFSSWVDDYADLTFWADFKPNDSYNARTLKIFKKNFFRAYGNVDLAPKEIKSIEYALHLIKCLKLMQYYYFHKQNKTDFQFTKKRLIKLLEMDL